MWSNGNLWKHKKNKHGSGDPNGRKNIALGGVNPLFAWTAPKEDQAVWSTAKWLVTDVLPISLAERKVCRVIIVIFNHCVIIA